MTNLFFLIALFAVNVLFAGTITSAFAQISEKETDISIFQLEDDLTIFVQLPKASQSLVKWSVYLNNSRNLIKTGSLSSSSQVECISHTIHQKGSQIAFLILYDKDGAPSFVKKAFVITTQRDLPVWLSTLIGVIVGAVLSLFSLLAKEEWTLRSKYRIQRIDTIGCILDYMERLKSRWLDVLKDNIPPIQDHLALNSKEHSTVITRDSSIRSELKVIETIYEFWKRTQDTNGEEEEKKRLQSLIEKYKRLLS